MAMLCRVKMTSRCIWPKAAVETEIISAGSLLKGRTRCCFFTTVCQQLTPFCKICGFPRRIQPRYARPGETSTQAALHILLKMATGRII